MTTLDLRQYFKNPKAAPTAESYQADESAGSPQNLHLVHQLKLLVQPLQKKPKTDVAQLSASGSKPNQPDPSVIPAQTVSVSSSSQRTTKLSFQKHWYETYPWLHFSPEVNGVLCFYCAKVAASGISDLATKAEKWFVSEGMSNWKKAISRFAKHEKSEAHKFSVAQLQQTRNPVDSLISAQTAESRKLAATALRRIVGSVRFLARQGLSLRGHSHDDGNFIQPLHPRASDVPGMEQWLQRKTSFTGWEIQNEILNMLSETVVRGIRSRIGNSKFCVIVDGTKDVSGAEQLSLCIRYSDDDLDTREDFIGFYEAANQRGETIAKITADVLLRLNLPMPNLRGQTYDGAANMSGSFCGAQALVKTQQPLALYVHCGAHCTNLVVQAAIHETAFLTDCIQWVHEVGVLFKCSSKMRQIFSQIAREADASSKILKPLCPTRWSVRTPAIKQTFSLYSSVCASLTELATDSDTHTATNARGLLDRFEKGNTLLGLQMALAVMEPLEALIIALQGKAKTVSGMLKAVVATKSELEFRRDEGRFLTVFNAASQLCEQNNLDPIAVPRRKRLPCRYGGSPADYQPETAADYFRQQYYQILDAAVLHLSRRFDQQYLQIYGQLEQILISGEANDSITGYPEFDKDLLDSQIGMFRRQNDYDTTETAIQIYRDFSPELRRLYGQVSQLLRLLVIIPASSSEAERSFSALRRLKSYLRSCMGQSRLNAVAVCHTHQEDVDRIDINQIAREFASRNENHLTVFGAN